MASSFAYRRLQKRQLSKKNNIFTCTLVVLLLVAVLVSISTLFLSSIAIQQDNAMETADQLAGGNNPPHLLKGSKDKISSNNNNGDITYAKVQEQRVIKEEEEEEDSKVVEQHPPIQDIAAKSPTDNSVIYQPPNKGKRQLTYRRFGGRLNNQLFQFITALQHAKVLKRTLVVPNEVRDVDWTGMFDVGLDIWDLEELNNAYDIDWTTGLSEEFNNKEDDTHGIPEECMISPKESRELLNVGPDLWRKLDEKCPDMIDILGNTGLLFCEQQHQFCGDNEAKMEAYKIYSHIKLSPSLMQHIPSKKEEFKNKGYDELALHSRRAGEGGYDWELCVKGNTRTCRGHTTGSDQDKFCDVRTMKGNCAVWLDLEYQIKSKSALKKNEKEYRFVLASDGTHDWNIDFKHQFEVANNTEWLLDLEKRGMAESMSISAFTKTKLRNVWPKEGVKGELKKDLSSMRSRIHALTLTLLDLFSLVDSKYLLGAYYSTLSLNACYFRGLDRIYDSNMCWMLMHPDTKYAVPPPSEETANTKSPSKTDYLPPALTSDIEHAFVRSDDGNFIAIDRYIIQYKKKQVISVLGDGLLPISILNNENGEETIRADFTCSYGDVHNSPATVILMKGNMPYKEHYYERGEKYNTPFSTNGDRFRTTIVMCEQLNFDRGQSRHPPLILRSSDDIFSISIGSSFQRPVGKVINAHSTTKHDKLVHCLNPAYGLKDPRWIIEYLEYHKAIGVAHVHVYNVDMHSPEVQSTLQMYRDEKFITRHDWSDHASGGYTTKKTYEHAKWAAQTDCALRSRGVYDYALFSDIDEIAVGDEKDDGSLSSAMEMCDKYAKQQRGIVACSFNSNTVSSIFTKLNDEEEMAMQDKLILERYNRIEAKPHCPSNCKCLGNNCSEMDRKFHTGRHKYIANVRDFDIAPRPMWTHALSRDYDEMNKVMEVLPESVMQVRHYQGHWYKNKDLLSTMEEKDAPLMPRLMNTVRDSIRHMHTKKMIYEKAKGAASSKGVEWIEVVDRPTSYHTLI